MNAEDTTKKDTTRYPAGEVIFFEGDIGNEMYIIKSGEIEIIREMGDSEIVLASLGENQFFGEMALFGDTKRSATVRASVDSELIVVNKQVLDAQFKKVPEWLVIMIKTIAKRILTTGKGIKINFSVNMQYSILKAITLLLAEYGMQEEKGRSINLTLVRQEIENIVGITTDEVDHWLKKFNFVNLIKIVSSKNKIIISDEERIQNFLTYLVLKSPQKDTAEGTIDQDTFKSFDRIAKLISR